MKPCSNLTPAPLLRLCAILWLALASAFAAPAPAYLSPTALVPSPDGKTLYVACFTANQVAFYDIAAQKITRAVSMPASPSGLALTADGAKLFVTCSAPESTICLVDTRSAKLLDSFPAGHTAMSPVLSPDQKTLFVCNRFNNQIALFDLASRKPVAQIPVPREPIAAAITPDGATLFVANHIHAGAADGDVVAATVSVIDTAKRQVTSQLPLPNGSGLLLDVKVSPNGQYAAVTHLLSRFHLPTTQLERGWMNTDALTLIDARQKKIINTVLLDNVDSGAANPWGIAWSADNATLVVAHSGTHELSVIDTKALLDKLAKMPTAATNAQTVDYTSASRVAADVPNDLSFLVGLRKRVKFKNDLGPRGVALIGQQAFAANYFSDTLVQVNLQAEQPAAQSLPLGPAQPLTVLRQGELYFNDARICFQGWQSCASCHSYDGRVDGLNWDLLNDGIGNPKNSKSLLLSHKTPPAMSQGVRDTAADAVRAGIRHILFTVQPEEVAVALDEWLKSLQPIPSPYLVKGKLSDAAKRGEKLFNSSATACSTCHPPGRLFTTMEHYDIGTRRDFDRTGAFDTPTLIETWRTAPYLHDGSAATMRDVFTAHNKADKHGNTSKLTPAQLDDLVAYILSL